MSNTESQAAKVYPQDPRDTDVVRNYYACQSHCCVRHGCKYGYHGCPVVTGQVVQDHRCEECSDALVEAAMYSGEPYPASGEVGYTVLLAASRTVADGQPALAGMPTDEQVQAKVAQALAGLDLGDGWTIARVTQS